ncbi:hypothetical protein ACQJBY_048149 [Aegilops geniculata]
MPPPPPLLPCSPITTPLAVVFSSPAANPCAQDPLPLRRCPASSPPFQRHRSRPNPPPPMSSTVTYSSRGDSLFLSLRAMESLVGLCSFQTKWSGRTSCASLRCCASFETKTDQPESPGIASSGII